MRIVEPTAYSSKRPVKRNIFRSQKKIIRLVLVALVLFGFVFYFARPWMRNRNNKQEVVAQTNNTNHSTNAVSPSNQNSGTPTLIEFSGNEFRLLYQNIRLPGVETIENPPSITGDTEADAHLRALAEARGYRLRYSATDPLVPAGNQQTLQKPAADAWVKLEAASKQANLQMWLVSGYRSIADQHKLFTGELTEAGLTAEKIKSGSSDQAIDKILTTTAPPGYSKHHTGYTFDLQCVGYDFYSFKDTPCNDWLSKDNFKVAKQLGFIPSYPPGADLQGPNPEAWEYVYMGTEPLYR